MIMLLDFDSIIYNSVYKCISYSEIRDIIESYPDNSREVYSNQILERGVANSNRIINETVEYVENTFTELLRVELYITACKRNFRYDIEPDYKKSRKRNKAVSIVRDYYKNGIAEYSDHLEADDLIADRARQLGLENCLIASIDKDLKTIGGNYWSYYKKKDVDRDGYPIKVYKQQEVMFISENEASRLFYVQLLMGDKIDNIIGLKGIGIKRAEKLLEDSTSYFITTAREYIKRERKEDFWKNYRLLKLGDYDRGH